MSSKTTSEQLGAALADLIRRRQRGQTEQAEQAEAAAPEARSRPPFTIAISREAGAEGAAIARAVGARLGWPVYDQELIKKVADDMGVDANVVKPLDEKRVSWLLECVQSFSSAPQAVSSAYVHRLAHVLLCLAAKGDCVILGRGAAQTLPPATTLRVRLIAPVDHRHSVIQRRLGVTHEDAVRWVAQTDQDRGRFVWDHFHRDPSDPHGYDLVVNTSRFGVDDCAAVVVETLRRMQTQPAPADDRVHSA